LEKLEVEEWIRMWKNEDRLSTYTQSKVT
jgi:hypothetical protein